MTRWLMQFFILLIILVGWSVPEVHSAVLDTFTDVDTVTLQSHNSTWMKLSGSSNLIIQSNQAAPSAAVPQLVYQWNAVTTSADSEVSVAIPNLGTGANRLICIGVRLSTNDYFTRTGYKLCASPTDSALSLYRLNAGGGASTLDIWGSQTIIPGSVLRLTANGSTITGYLDGIQKMQVTDATHSAAGRLGLEVYALSGGTDMRLDDFSGGPYGPVAPPTVSSILDTFTGTTGASLETYNTNWLNIAGPVLEIQANQAALRSAGPTYTAYHRNEIMSSADVATFLTITQLGTGSGRYWCVGARLTDNGPTTRDGYLLCGTPARLVIHRLDNGSVTQLVENTSYTPTAGDVMKFTVVGSTLTGYINDISQLNTTDATYSAAGQMSLEIGSDSGGNDMRFDNVGSDLNTNPVPPPPLVLDQFTGTDDTPLETHDSNWVKVSPFTDSMILKTNELAQAAAGPFHTAYHWNAVTSGADSEVSIVMTNPGTPTDPWIWCVGLRMTTNVDATRDGYMLCPDGGTSITLYRVDDGVFNWLGWNGGTLGLSPGDTLRLVAMGSSLKGYVNTTEIISVTDSTYSAAGYLAIEINTMTAGGTDSRWDNFAGGPYDAPPPPPPPPPTGLLTKLGNTPWFTTDGSTAVYLTGSSAHHNMVDAGTTNPISPVFDFTEYLDLLANNHHNYIRLWTWNSQKIDAGFGVVYQNPMPWKCVSGTPPACTSYDLSQFDTGYFTQLRQRVIDAGNRGMYVGILLFEGWAIQNWPGSQYWDYSAWRSGNNVNSINGDTNSDGYGAELYTGADSNIVALEKAYVQHVIDTVNDLDNVVYEIANEAQLGSKSWQYDMINFIHTQEALLGRQHPVGMSSVQDMIGGFTWGTFADLTASNADFLTPGGPEFDWKGAPPVNNGQRAVIVDTDHIGISDFDDIVNQVWKNFTRGNHFILMDTDIPVTGSFGCCAPNVDFVEVRANMGYTKDYAQKMDLAAMLPVTSTSIISTGYGLKSDCQEYLMWQPTAATNSINLTACPNVAFDVEYLDPATGTITFDTTLTGGSTTNFISSGKRVVYLKPQSVSASLTLIWNASVDEVGGSGLGGYTARRCQGTNCQPLATLTTIGAGNTSYTDTFNLQAGIEYCYDLNAFDVAGNQSAFSTKACGTPGGVTITDPRIDSLVSTATTATVSWGVGSPTAPTSILLENDFTSVGYTATTSPQAITRSLLVGQTFECAVAVNSSGTAIHSPPEAVKCQDVTSIAPPSDTNPPILSNPQPSSILPAGTTSTIISVEVDKTTNVTCRYDTQDVSFVQMINTMIITAMTASATVTGLTDGSITIEYVRCNFVDTQGTSHPNTTSVPITVQVASPADVTPPVRSGGSPNGVLASGTTSVIMQLSTNENATCKYGTTADVVYGSIANTFTTTGATAHSQTIVGLSDGQTSTYYVRCQDAAANANTTDFIITWSVAPTPDTTPPVLSGGSPNGVLASGTTSVLMQVTSSETATCKYDTADLVYSSLANTFTTTNQTLHSQTITVSDGNSYTYYVRCQDVAGNANTSGFAIMWSVENTPAPPDITPPIRSLGSPSGVLPSGTTSVTLALTTDETATCKFDTTSGVAYGSMANTFTNTNDTTHTNPGISVTHSTTYTYYVRCQDADNNANTTDFLITWSVDVPPDITPPIRSAGLPVGEQPLDTTSVNMQLTTDENATCRYSSSPGVAYTGMTSTFTTTGTTSHAQTIGGLTNGSIRTFYVKCVDGSGNANTSDFVITWTVASPPTDTELPSTVTGLVCTAFSQSQEFCSWDPATDNVAVLGYNYYYSLGADSTTYNFAGFIENATSVVVNIPPFQLVNTVVKAVDTSQNLSLDYSNVSTVTTFTPVDLVPPSDMANLRIIVQFGRSILLGWDACIDNSPGCVSTIEQCVETQSGVVCDTWNTVYSLITGTFFAVPDLLPGFTYCWRGLNVDASSNRSVNYSNTVCTPITSVSGAGTDRRILSIPRRGS